MEPGEISQPVLTRFGWHIIKVEEKTPESVRTLEEATESIRDQLKAEEADILAYDAAESIYDATFDGDDLTLVAEARNLPLHRTDWFTRQGPDKEIEKKSEFAATVFDLEIMAISDIKDFGDGYYLVQTTDKAPEARAPFEEVAGRVRADLVAERQAEMASEAARDFLVQVTEEGKDLAEAAERLEEVTVETTDFFKRDGAIPGLGGEREIAQAAFDLSSDTPFPEAPVKGRQGVYVIRFTERKIPDEAAFEKEKKSIKQQLLRQKQFRAFNTWLSEVRARSEIEQFIDMESPRRG
jgi:peptidyl-prolyl cis-trans isomerase D